MSVWEAARVLADAADFTSHRLSSMGTGIIRDTVADAQAKIALEVARLVDPTGEPK